jgi:hypothetical protein
MSSIAHSTQSTRPDSIGSTENPGSTFSTKQVVASTQSIANQDAAIEAIRSKNDQLRRRVNRSMKDFDQQPETLAPNEQQGGNENKPEN